MGAEDSTDGRCDFCRLPCSAGVVESQYGDHTYRFCSEACRDAMADADRVFTQYHDFRRFAPGVDAFDRSLPQGWPRNAFVLVSAQTGTRDRAVGAELVWRSLERGEPVIVVSFTEPPIAVVEQFLTLDWNVIPHLESGRLHLLDCFTYRLNDPDRLFHQMSEWNHHLHSVAEKSTTSVRDPTDLRSLTSTLDNCLESRNLRDTGVVLIDSLTEIGSLVPPVKAYEFVKNVRAEVCKGRFVPVFAGATYTGDEDEFPHDMEYVADGVIDLQVNPDVVEDTLIKRARIRKLNEVLVYPEWHAYEYTSGEGMVVFDPLAEIEKSRRARERAEKSASGEEPRPDEPSADREPPVDRDPSAEREPPPPDGREPPPPDDRP